MVALSRYLFDAEPDAVTAASDIDPLFGVDTLTAGILRFGRGIASIDTSSAFAIHQRLVALGTEGKLMLDMPATPDPTQPTVLHIVDKSAPRTQQWVPCNQYRLMFDEVSAAIRGTGELPVPPAATRAPSRLLLRQLRSGAGSHFQRDLVGPLHARICSVKPDRKLV